MLVEEGLLRRSQRVLGFFIARGRLLCENRDASFFLMPDYYHDPMAPIFAPGNLKLNLLRQNRGLAPKPYRIPAMGDGVFQTR